MLKLVRTALTAAILTAIAVRLRRRSHRETAGETAGGTAGQASGHATSEARRPGRDAGTGLSARGARRAGRVTPLVLGAGAIVAVALVVATALVTPAATTVPATTAPVMPAAATPPPAPSAPATPAGASPSADPETPLGPGCRPRSRPVVVRPIDPRVRRAVNRQWGRVERWLRRNAPRTYATLGARSRPRTIAFAEAYMGMEFPDALRASLLRHNGAAYFGFFGERLYGVRQIRAVWRDHCREGGRDGWGGELIPVASQGEPELFVSGEKSGSLGELAEIGEESRTSEPAGLKVRSYYALLKATADALERGRLGEWRPRVVDGSLVWDRR
ncbi:SMI1/KNR4 family protein [Nonomuraea sp. NPDC005501]|uniref:SMI1/KNR4 family protein n=1 Tax=Nonomuraea sp. NPDC005501 TaxID=3156884 RepID=UPI0033AEB8BB